MDIQKPFEGVLKITRKGKGIVVREDDDTVVEIEAADLNTGLNRDTVRVSVIEEVREGRFRGIITDILYREKMRFVGTLKKETGVSYLVPDDTRMYADIIIPEQEAANIKKNEKVYVKIVKWNDPKLNPIGEIISVLGPKGDNDVEMRSILLEKGLAPSFPPEVIKQAEKIDRAISQEEIAKRRDMRSVPTFTIDPDTAEDFDDAISFQTLPDGTIEVGIHIADVTHYVKEGSAIDNEASKRGTSIYLVDRVIPMLPEVLSNDVCSLTPETDKLTYSVIVTFSKDSLSQKHPKIIDTWIGRTVIHSNKRFTYDEAQKAIDEGSGVFASEIQALNTLAKKLRAQRAQNGSIMFERDEVKFELDEKGTPIGVYVKEVKDTNKLIEELMLVANKKVAEYIEKLDPRVKKIFVYRVHDVPDSDKVSELRAFLKTLGYNLPVGKNGLESKDVNQLLDEIKGTAEEDLIQISAIRTMAKAMYSTKNIGHFSLSFTYYTHFTSPIRRYPDVLVHRLLEKYQNDINIPEGHLRLYESASRYVSERERIASEAERESIKYKQAEYMAKHIGEVYEGIISNATQFGIFVEESTTHADGFIHISELGDDYFEYDEKRFALFGKKSKRRFRLGDEVKVRVKDVNIDTKEISFELID